MRDGVLARECLNELGLALGAADTPRTVIEALYRSSDPFEIGVAATFSADAAARALVYYNPRRRGAAFLRRVHQACAAHGVAADWLGSLHESVPFARLSCIAGFDVTAEGVSGGTLYLEELHARLGGGADSLVTSLAERLGLPSGGSPEQRVGAPYILAVDFSRTGPERLKLYHFAEASARGAVRSEAEAVVGRAALASGSPAAEALFGDGPCSGFITQQAFGAGGLLRHKVYRCFPYEEERTEGLARRALEGLGLTEGGTRSRVGAATLEVGFGTTSVGLAWAPGSDTLEYVSVYQCLLRGDS